MKDNTGIKYWLAFSKIQKIGPINFGRIINRFSSLEEGWGAKKQDFIKAGLEEKLAEEITIARNQINPDEELDKLEKEQIKISRIIDADYPPLLKEIYNPPAIIYYRGSLECLKDFCLAVVGTRKSSIYGRQATETIVNFLASQKITIVSGLALGIDSISHKACLDSGGKTAAVLGSGIDWSNIYPSTNRHLAQQIIDSGGIVMSEYPIGTVPAKFTFPARNRIVAGLSKGVIITEAPESSGALITARCAVESNREVFAVPGNINQKNSAGTNNLIKNGAIIVVKPEDVLEEFNLQPINELLTEDNNQKLTDTEKIILQHISAEPSHIDKIAKSSKLKINALSSALTMMEIKGLIKDLGGKNYIIKNRS